MCFSAGASFAAGVLLTVVGSETVRKVHRPSQIAFASIPVFFAAQQFAEGGLWLTIGQAGHAGAERLFTYLFLVMAQIVWPILFHFRFYCWNATRQEEGSYARCSSRAWPLGCTTHTG